MEYFSEKMRQNKSTQLMINSFMRWFRPCVIGAITCYHRSLFFTPTMRPSAILSPKRSSITSMVIADALSLRLMLLSVTNVEVTGF